MIDFETIRTIVLITLIAIIATLLRRKAGFVIVLWAFALGFFIAAKIIKMQATRQFIPPS
jgi:energy-coupling factor transporter transmembrane protein EcfT